MPTADAGLKLGMKEEKEKEEVMVREGVCSGDRFVFEGCGGGGEAEAAE